MAEACGSGSAQAKKGLAQMPVKLFEKILTQWSPPSSLAADGFRISQIKTVSFAATAEETILESFYKKDRRFLRGTDLKGV